MAISFLGVETSVILVAVFSVIRSYAQNGTQLENVTIAEDNTTAPVYNTSTTYYRRVPLSIIANETTTELPTLATNFTSSTSSEKHTRVSTSNRLNVSLITTTEDERDEERITAISSPPKPSNVALPPGAMMTISAITCAVIIGVFIVCYMSTMMNLCFCKFLMHECPTGRFKDEADAAAKKEKGKKKDEAPLPDAAAPSTTP